MMNNKHDWPLGIKGIIGIAGCLIGLGVVSFGYGIGTESPKKDASAQAKPAQQSVKKPVRAMNMALGNMVFFARDLEFSVKSANGGALDSNRIAARIESQLNGVRQLYRDEVAKNPVLAGSLVLQFNIAPEGDVSHVREVSSRISDADFRKAVLGQASKWSFSELVAENLQVTCALLFVHEGMDITTLIQWEKALAQTNEKPTVARASGSGIPNKPVRTAQVAAPAPASPRPAAPALVVPSAQRTTAKVKEFQIKYATSLRRNPNFSAPSLTTFTIGTRVIALGREGDWLEVRSMPNGPTGFIRKEFVTPIEVARQ
jgi:hypothetical protein